MWIGNKTLLFCFQKGSVLFLPHSNYYWQDHHYPRRITTQHNTITHRSSLSEGFHQILTPTALLVVFVFVFAKWRWKQRCRLAKIFRWMQWLLNRLVTKVLSNSGFLQELKNHVPTTHSGPMYGRLVFLVEVFTTKVESGINFSDLPSLMILFF